MEFILQRRSLPSPVITLEPDVWKYPGTALSTLRAVFVVIQFDYLL